VRARKFFISGWCFSKKSSVCVVGVMWALKVIILALVVAVVDGEWRWVEESEDVYRDAPEENRLNVARALESYDQTAPQAFQDPAQNLGKQCWYKCGDKGGYCDSFCGANTPCCRRGWGDDPYVCRRLGIGCDGYHCCAKKEVLIKNLGKDCWGGCGNKDGDCHGFCGLGGQCCKLNAGLSWWKDDGRKGCPGGVGCKTFHCCVKKEEGRLNSLNNNLGDF